MNINTTNTEQKHTLFITGAAGYVGGMLAHQFSKRDDVVRIIALDREPIPEMLKDNKKIYWIKANTNDTNWQKEVLEHNPSVVIHTAWQIRDMYGNKATQWKWNVDGSNNVFDFAFNTPSVKKLIYFSTAAIYGAYKTNTIEHRFTEDEPMREEEYLYGIEKKQVENNLFEKWNASQKKDQKKDKEMQVFVVRPAAITGPRGRFMRVRFGLQSALSGQLKGNFIYHIISLMVSFVPATPWWVRQFIHEDDVYDIMELFALKLPTKGEYTIFNITPPGEPVLAPHMAEAVGKKIIPVRPWMVRLAYFFFWHATRGKVPTSKGIWRFYSYPIVLDGSKLIRIHNYTYSYPSRDAFKYTTGRYEQYVPKEMRRKKLT